MASYLELFSLRGDTDLRGRVRVAATTRAQDILDAETAAPNSQGVLLLTWAVRAFRDQDAVMNEIYPCVLASNKSLTLGQITSSSDSALQAAVDSVVNLFAVNPPA